MATKFVLCALLLAALQGLASADTAQAPEWATTGTGISIDSSFNMVSTYGPCALDVSVGSSDPTLNTCGWTASCAIEDCTSKCIPNRSAHHAGLEGSVAVVGMRAMKCSMIASMVKAMAGGLFGGGRKMLSSESSGMEAAAGRKLANSLANFMSRINDVAGKQSDLTAVHSRRLTEASDETALACATDEEVDDAAPMLMFMAAAMSTDNSPFEDVTDGTVVPTPEETMMQDLVAELLTSPEEIKGMMQSDCYTDEINTEPLLSMYHSMLVDMNSDYDSPSLDDTEATMPESVTACRPRGDGDVEVIQALARMELACGSAAETVTNGPCMAEEVANPLNSTCFDARMAFLEVPAEHSTSLKAAMTSIHEACTEATTQSACEAVDMPSEEAAAASVLDSVQETLSTPEPSRAGANHGYTLALIAALAAMFAALW